MGENDVPKSQESTNTTTDQSNNQVQASAGQEGLTTQQDPKTSKPLDSGGGSPQPEIEKIKILTLNALKRKRHEFQTLCFELEQQHELFHRIYTNQRLWHSRLSLFVILLSSSMTLMSSLTFVLPSDWVESKHDRIPNIALSFLVTIISSILKWGGWDARSEETKTTASNITSWMTQIKNQLTVIDELKGGTIIEGDKPVTSKGNRKIEVDMAVFKELQRVQKEARAAATKSREVIFNLKPTMVLDYEKRILEGALVAQNTEITRTFSSMFKTKLDEYYKEEGNLWEVKESKEERNQSYPGSSVQNSKDERAHMARHGNHEYLNQFSKLINDQRNILATHEHMLNYANNYKRSMFAERTQDKEKKTSYALRKLLWWMCCWAKCAEPEILPVDPKPLPLENSKIMKIDEDEERKTRNDFIQDEIHRELERRFMTERLELEHKQRMAIMRSKYRLPTKEELELVEPNGEVGSLSEIAYRHRVLNRSNLRRNSNEESDDDTGELQYHRYEDKNEATNSNKAVIAPASPQNEKIKPQDAPNTNHQGEYRIDIPKENLEWH